MRSFALCCLVLVLSGCAVEREATVPHFVGPVLTGYVTDSSGQPIPDLKVRLYSGIGTYFPKTFTQTNGQGVFHLKITSGAGEIDKDGQIVRYSIGLRFKMEGLPDNLHWVGWVPVDIDEARVHFQIADGAVHVIKGEGYTTM